MDEALILERLDNLSSEIRSLKSNMLEELKQDLGPVIQQLLPKATQALAEIDDQFEPAELTALIRNTLCNLKHFNSALGMMKAGMELKEDLGPVVQQSLPRMIEFAAELDGQFNMDDFQALLRKTLSNLGNIASALDTLNATMELKNDLGQVMKIALPKVQEFMADLHEGEFQAEQLGNLMRTFLLNVQTFSDLMNMLKPMTEFINDAGVVVRQADIFSKVNKTLDGMQHCGLMKLMNTVMESLKEIDCTSEQVEQMCEIIYEMDFKKSNKITPFGAYKKMKDPKVQEALGAGFMMLELIGTMLQTYRAHNAAK
jgi:uncharacterized protein YjgD (DUF1641 family)